MQIVDLKPIGSNNTRFKEMISQISTQISRDINAVTRSIISPILQSSNYKLPHEIAALIGKDGLIYHNAVIDGHKRKLHPR